MAAVQDELDELREAVEKARRGYQQAVAIERELFERRNSGSTPKEIEENFSRWIEQHGKQMEALNRYQEAADAYTEAIKRALRK